MSSPTSLGVGVLRRVACHLARPGIASAGKGFSDLLVFFFGLPAGFPMPRGVDTETF